ncbi:unnamed protein product, partial [Polarella glacialis]
MTLFIPKPKTGVPKLTMAGIRPSLQGSGSLGCAPPEEPGQEPEPPPPMKLLTLPSAQVALDPGGGSHGDFHSPPGSDTRSYMTTCSAVGGPAAQPEVGDLSCAGIVHQNVFYFEGRQQRRIYEDVELHSLILTLILSLLMTPKHGLLDSRYCDQYPIMR